MTDNTELKRLAERVIDIEALDGGEPIGEAWGEFEAAATPAVVLALIAENDELRNVGSQLRAFFVDATEQCCKAERERDQLRAEVAGLKTGYEAYERVNAELKAGNEMLKRDSEKSFANGRNRGLDEASNLCYQLALAQYRPEGSRYTLFIPKANKALGDVLVGACNLIADLPDGPLRRHRERQERKAAMGKGEQS